MDKDCKNCVFHSTTDSTSLMCDYPVPRWIKLIPPGGFVSGYEAKRCATYKDKSDLVKDAKQRASYYEEARQERRHETLADQEDWSHRQGT